jgi:iron complex outermembrane recepter protein
MFFKPHRLAMAVAAACAATMSPLYSAAQTAPAAADNPHEPARIPAVVVTGNPLGSDLFDLVSPVTTLSGERLKQRLQPTLGETLGNEVGINSTYYGPNASRPVIRGLDGDHIRILQNSVGTIDASGTSVDHAVSLDPLLIQRVEVVRGPATLLYGGSAVGGVVNVIDGRIPQSLPDGKVSGAAEARYASVNKEKSGAAYVDAGGGSDGQGFVLHFDGFKRDTSDLKIPGFARSARLREIDPLPAGEEEASGRLPNSASESNGGGVGGSYVWNKGYFGAAYSQYNTDYGTVAEEDVTIKLRQKRFDLAGEIDDLSDVIKSVKVKFGQSDYQHTEFEGPDPGTVFKNKGYEGRVDIAHNKLGPFQGAVGFQTQKFDFSALGDEAFLPQTHTTSYAGFVYEELPLDALKLQFGLRIDKQKVEADEDANFGPADSRSFTPKSASFGFVYALNQEYAVVLSTSYTERAPNYQELYANGPHLATNAFEVGDRDLGIEKSTGVDIALRKRGGPFSGSVGAFYNRFKNYITLTPTGVIDPTFDVEKFNYVAVPADFYGLEAEGTYYFIDKPGERLALELKSDYIRAKDRDTGEPLPRISPLRFGAAMNYELGAFGSRFEVQRVQKQDRVADNELPTDGYTLVNASFDYHLKLAKVDWSAFIKGTNLLNREARNHVSFLKDIAPLGGRGVLVGVNARF